MGKWKVSGSGWSSFLMGRYLAGPADERSPAELKHGLDGVLQQEPVFSDGDGGGIKRKCYHFENGMAPPFPLRFNPNLHLWCFWILRNHRQIITHSEGGGVSPLNQQTARPAQGWTESDSLTPHPHSSPCSPLTPPVGQLHPRQRWEVRGECVLAAGPQQSVRLLLNESSTLLLLLLFPLFALLLLLLLLLLILLLTESF